MPIKLCLKKFASIGLLACIGWPTRAAELELLGKPVLRPKNPTYDSAFLPSKTALST